MSSKNSKKLSFENLNKPIKIRFSNIKFIKQFESKKKHSVLNTNENSGHCVKRSFFDFFYMVDKTFFENTLMSSPSCSESSELCRMNLLSGLDVNKQIDSYEIEDNSNLVSVDVVRKIDSVAHMINSNSRIYQSHTKRSSIQTGISVPDNFFNIQNTNILQNNMPNNIQKCLRKKKIRAKVENNDSEISLDINFEDKITGISESIENLNVFDEKAKQKDSVSKTKCDTTSKRFISPSKWSFETSDKQLQIKDEQLEEEKHEDVTSKPKKHKKHYKSVLIMNEFKNYDDLIVKKSEIHGLGIFTPVKIPVDTLIMEYKGEIIGKCMSNKREKQYRKNNIDSIYMFSVSEDMIIDATMMGNKARFINHSCDPNCEAIHSMIDKSIKYCTIKDIDVGEELTINYNMSKDYLGEVCNCGHSNCRSKVIN